LLPPSSSPNSSLIDPNLYDANLAPGIESYILSLKAAPIRWILGLAGAGTNKAEGVRLITLTPERGHYLAHFARLMLAVGELRNGSVQQGKAFLIDLSKSFPRTPSTSARSPDFTDPTSQTSQPTSEIQHATRRTVYL
jgi:hypothetical protein